MTVKEISIEQKNVNDDKRAFFKEFSDLLKKYDVEFEVDLDDTPYGGGYVNGIDFDFNSIKTENGEYKRYYDTHRITGQYHDYTNYIVDI